MITGIILGVIVGLVPVGIMLWLYMQSDGRSSRATQTTDVHYVVGGSALTAEELQALRDEELRRFDALIRRHLVEQSKRA